MRIASFCEEVVLTGVGLGAVPHQALARSPGGRVLTRRAVEAIDDAMMAAAVAAAGCSCHPAGAARLGALAAGPAGAAGTALVGALAAALADTLGVSWVWSLIPATALAGVLEPAGALGTAPAGATAASLAAGWGTRRVG